eukprot:gene744-23_t
MIYKEDIVKPGMPASGNHVADDKIWKDHIHHEHNAAKWWPENWGFLSTLHREFAGENNDLVDKEPAAMRVKNRREALKLPPIDQNVLTQLSVVKPTQTFPKTTSRMIGWRSSEEQCKLERYGRDTKKNQTFLKSMKWPLESII